MNRGWADAEVAPIPAHVHLCAKTGTPSTGQISFSLTSRRDSADSNLVRGFVGTLIAVAASISTTVTGFMFQILGHREGFLILAGIALIALALLWAAMPETKPGEYLD